MDAVGGTGVCVERGGSHGEGGKLVPVGGAGKGIDEATTIRFAAGVDPVRVDAVGMLQMFDEVGSELQVVNACDCVGGALPVFLYSQGICGGFRKLVGSILVLLCATR